MARKLKAGNILHGTGDTIAGVTAHLGYLKRIKAPNVLVIKWMKRLNLLKNTKRSNHSKNMKMKRYIESIEKIS